MNPTVRDFMNTHLVYLREDSRPEIALLPILDFGITAVPVLDAAERPVGMVSLRDLVDPRKREPHVSKPVVTVAIDEPISSAAKRLAEAGVHHVVVLDSEGRAAGMLSAVDIIRALIGLEAKHPKEIDAFGRKQILHAPDRT
jgi:CBS domain-containing protein